MTQSMQQHLGWHAYQTLSPYFTVPGVQDFKIHIFCFKCGQNIFFSSLLRSGLNTLAKTLKKIKFTLMKCLFIWIKCSPQMKYLKPNNYKFQIPVNRKQGILVALVSSNIKCN